MIIAFIPLLFALIGLLMYVLASNAKVSELGRILFLVGWFFTMYSVAGKTVHLL